VGADKISNLMFLEGQATVINLIEIFEEESFVINESQLFSVFSRNFLFEI